MCGRRALATRSTSTGPMSTSRCASSLAATWCCCTRTARKKCSLPPARVRSPIRVCPSTRSGCITAICPIPLRSSPINNTPVAGADIYKIHLETRQVVRLTHQEYTPNTSVRTSSAAVRRVQHGAVSGVRRQSGLHLEPQRVHSAQAVHAGHVAALSHGRGRQQRRSRSRR